MTWLWLAVAFTAGFLVSWYWGVAILARLFRRPKTTTTRKVVARMPHAQLLELTGLLHTEIMSRQQRLPDSTRIEDV